MENKTKIKDISGGFSPQTPLAMVLHGHAYTHHMGTHIHACITHTELSSACLHYMYSFTHLLHAFFICMYVSMYPALITHQYVVQMGWKKLHLHES